MNPAVVLQHQAATDECPWCGSTISRARFLEIQRRIADEERRKLSIERARLQEQLKGELQKAETKLKLDAEKKVAAIVAERDQAAAALKAQALKAEAARKTAERQLEEKLKAEFQQKLEAVAAERDEASAKAKKLDSAKQKELQQQRESLERDRDSKLLKAQVQHNRDKEQLLQKIDGLTRQLQRKTSNELGDGAEVDVYESLRSAFTRDDITRIKKGQPGADIRHDVVHKGVSCGVIVLDSKNRQGWQHSYVTKLREDQMAAKADYAILATTVFPAGRKELYVWARRSESRPIAARKVDHLRA